MNVFDAVTFVSIGAAAGFVGGLLGLGGGVILVPALTLICHVPVKTAIAASAFVVLVNAHVVSLQKSRLASVNISSAIILQLAALVFSLVGASISVQIDPLILSRLFAGAAFVIAVFMLVFGRGKAAPVSASRGHDDPFRKPARQGTLVFVAALSGTLAGALGVGGGIFLVPALQFIGRLPARVATATSSYTMAVTGAGAALVYLSSPYMRPAVTVLCLVGVAIGGIYGNRVGHAAKGRVINTIFAIVLLIVGVRMWIR